MMSLQDGSLPFSERSWQSAETPGVWKKALSLNIVFGKATEQTILEAIS